MKAATDHMDGCVIRVSQRVFDLVPKLKSYIKTDRQGLANVYHTQWHLADGEIIMSLMKADMQLLRVQSRISENQARIISCRQKTN